MFFNQEYYRSLWFILKNDKKNRKRILEFIHSFPSTLYDELLKKTNNNVKKNVYKKLIIDGIVYYYEVNDGSITIGSFSQKNSCKENIFVIRLYPYKNVLPHTKDLVLGDLIYQSKYFDSEYVYDCDKVKYSLEKNKFGSYFVFYYEYGLLFNRRKIKVNVEDIPSCMNLETFEVKKNSIVRRKNRFINKEP